MCNLGARWRCVVSATPRSLCPHKGASTHRTRGWVGTGTGLEGCGKSRPLLGFELRTVQPLASRCTDYAVPAHALVTNNVDFLMVEMFKQCMF
jgi:hypothetical protein